MSLSLTNGKHEGIIVSNCSEHDWWMKGWPDHGPVTLNAEKMGVGIPRPFQLEGVWLVAIARADGSVDFYTIPTDKEG